MSTEVTRVVDKMNAKHFKGTDVCAPNLHLRGRVRASPTMFADCKQHQSEIGTLPITNGFIQTRLISLAASAEPATLGL
jgi:hypothetical protein